jgi:diadenosine tetraphosphatase ApaH/serine/threonine PP2A family protein phosphatase
MRVAIISDIHSNLEALQKTLEIIDEKKVEEIVCLGDLVGYGASPNECVELTRKRASRILLGNHDQAAFDLSQTEHFNRHARTAAYWTNQTLTQENLEYLKSLPFQHVIDDLTFVHASPRDPEQWEYVFSAHEAKTNFESFQTRICFVGHTHIPGVFPEDLKMQKSKVTRENRYIINVGSVGQPRDGNWKLSFGIFDTSAWTYDLIRSEYDVQAASEKIVAADLPRFLADRLLVGI